MSEIWKFSRFFEKRILNPWHKKTCQITDENDDFFVPKIKIESKSIDESFCMFIFIIIEDALL